MFKRAEVSEGDGVQDTPLSSFIAVLLCIAQFGLVATMWWGHSLVTGEAFDSQRRLVGYVSTLGILAYLLLKGFRDLKHVPVGAVGEMSITPLKAIVVVVMLAIFTYLCSWLLGITDLTTVIDGAER